MFTDFPQSAIWATFRLGRVRRNGQLRFSVISTMIDDLGISEDLKNELRGLNALKTQNGFQIGFPILNDPAGVVFNMLLGRDSDLFFFQAAAVVELEGTEATGLSFAGQPIDFFGQIDIDTHLRFGYDTFGLRQLIANFAPGDASHIVSDITDGFYVNSDSYFKLAGASGVDVGFPVGSAIFIHASGGISTQNHGLDPVHVYIEVPMQTASCGSTSSTSATRGDQQPSLRPAS
jgi:hypothetical protein